jgi:uncharacterized damage-inducible protein DinB
MVDGALEEAFQAHGWADRRLLDFCTALDAEQLAARHRTTRWSVLQTFTHIVSADGYYLGSLTGQGRIVPAWNEDEDPAWSIDDLRERAAKVSAGWDDYLKTDDDSDRLLVIDGGTFECRAGVLVAQALHHGDLHREQICEIVRDLGLEPPDLQTWEYAIDTGRARFLDTAPGSGPSPVHPTGSTAPGPLPSTARTGGLPTDRGTR